MRAMAWACGLVVLAGCRQILFPPTAEEQAAAELVRKHGPDGQQTAECRRPSSCFEEAKEVCPHGYDVMDKTQDVSGGGFIPLHMRVTLVYECRHPERERERTSER